MPLTRREPQAYGTTKPGGARRLALLYVLGCIMRQSLVITNTGPVGVSLQHTHTSLTVII